MFLTTYVPAVALLALVYAWLEWRVRPERPVPLHGWRLLFIGLVTASCMAAVVASITWGWYLPSATEPAYGLLLAGQLAAVTIGSWAIGICLSRREATYGIVETRDARAAVPDQARALFASEALRAHVERVRQGAFPSPALASDLVAFWAAEALDNRDLVGPSWVIFDGAYVRGWRFDAPAVADAVNALIAPYQHGSDREWDPRVDQQFRYAAVTLLRGRYGAAVRNDQPRPA